LIVPQTELCFRGGDWISFYEKASQVTGADLGALDFVCRTMGRSR
jgi:hypothetical protein